MNDEDILEFIEAFSDFLKHAEVEEFYYDGRTLAQLHTEQKASELGISTEYYLMEFV